MGATGMSTVEVKVGQIWADNDPRSRGRTIKVISIAGEKAVVECVSVARNVGLHNVGRKTVVSLKRFNPNRQTGYTLVQDV